MRLTSIEEMRKIDTLLGDCGIPEIIPMEHAGKAVADVALTIMGDKKKVVIICGKGNNGGDGFGAARWLDAYGKHVMCFGTGASRNEAMTEYNMLSGSGVEVVTLRTQADLDYCRMSISKTDLVIDALLGTGFSGELEEDYIKLCDVINSSNCPVLSIDVPSGVNGDNGEVARGAVQADMTVTLARPKVGMFLYPARENVGEIVLAKIGFAPKLLEQDQSKFYLVDDAMARDLLPIRPADAHKGDNGRVTVVAGSPGFVGAASLCTKAAVKTGAGLVYLFTPASVSSILAMKLDEEMVHSLPEVLPGCLGNGTAETVLNFGGNVLAIGPGLGTGAETAEQIRLIVQNCQIPMILDADALTALTGHLELLQSNKAPKVLTPHSGEFARMVGLDVEEVNSRRLELAVKYAQKWQVVLLLKGAPTIIALPGGAVYIVDSGCSAMATGGSGDVLTGIIAALVAQGLEADSAAICGAYLHGIAGSIATDEVPGLAAGEIAQSIPLAWKRVYEENDDDSFINGAVRVVG